MAQRHFYRNDDGDMEEVEGAILVDEYPLEEKAEEGSVGSPVVTVADPAMTRNFVGHRRWNVYEDTSEDANEMIFAGFVWTQKIRRGFDAKTFEPLGRSWQLQLVDTNTLWSNRVLVGADCKRPAETDVERMQWLVATSEMGYFDDLTLLSTASPVAMDKNDYTGQMVNAVADDCAQQSGKNWWIGCTGTVGEIGSDLFVWYGKDSLTAYASGLSISNDPADWDDDELADGTSLVWPAGDDGGELERNPDRQFSGGLLAYEKGQVYRQRAASLAAFSLSGRDLILPHANVKTKAKAIARLLRTLEDVSVQDERITVPVTVPAAKASMIRAGMRIPFRSTFMPGYEDGRILRILTATPKQQDAESRYQINLVLQGPGDEPAGALSCSTAMANATASTLDELEVAGSGTMSLAVSPTFAGPTILIPVFSVTSGNPGTTIGAFSGGFSTLESNDRNGSAFRVGFQQGTAPGTFTAGASWTAFGDGGTLAVHAAIPSSATGPVQDFYGQSSPALPAPPTPGNIVVMVCHVWSGNVITGPGPSGPTTGWTLLGSVSNNGTMPVPPYNGINKASINVYARCVQEGEDGTYDFSFTGAFPGAYEEYLAEFEV